MRRCSCNTLSGFCKKYLSSYRAVEYVSEYYTVDDDGEDMDLDENDTIDTDTGDLLEQDFQYIACNHCGKQYTQEEYLELPLVEERDVNLSAQQLKAERNLLKINGFDQEE
jgi:hypothetical protein